jgi:hypothetical protein
MLKGHYRDHKLEAASQWRNPVAIKQLAPVRLPKDFNHRAAAHVLTDGFKDRDVK